MIYYSNHHATTLIFQKVVFMKLTVVLPTYNEAENLRPMVEALLALTIPYQLQILIVDDNSPDGTGDLADQLAVAHQEQVKVLHRKVKDGLGRAYLAGFKYALSDGADFIVHMDCDFSHQPKYIPEMIEAIEGADVVIGSRYIKGGSVDNQWHWTRKLLSWFANSVYVRLALNIKVYDATGGFRLWRRDTLIGMDLENRIQSNGYIFHVEMSYVASQLGYRIKEIPIHFPDRREGVSKMSFAIQLEAAMRVLQVRVFHRDLRPDLRFLPKNV